jgi:hypothetical protein
MQYWRVSGHLYPQEEFLRAGADVVVSSGKLAAALEHAGYPADRFDDGAPDGGKPWLLGADGRLTQIRYEHVADMLQRDFDELVGGSGPFGYQAGDAYDPAAAVEQHRAWTAAIRASIKQGRK